MSKPVPTLGKPTPPRQAGDGMQYLLLFGAIASEVIGTLALRVAANGRSGFYAVVAVGYVVAFTMLWGSLRLGMPLHQEHTVRFRPELGLGEEADGNMLASAVGLVWRTLLLWLLLILLITITHYF